MTYNIDEYKINQNKVFINGWVHSDHYKVIVVSNEEEKEIKQYHSRYDICMKFHEKIEDNRYGFKEEITFHKNTKKVKAYLVSDNTKELMLSINEGKIHLFLNKIRRFLGKIKRGIAFLWREYHFLVPPTMMKQYLKMGFSRKEPLTIYNPEISSEYHLWLEKQKFEKDKEKSNKDLSIIQVNDKECKNKILKENKKYICLQKGKIELSNYFYYSIKEELENDYDLIYFDNDFKKKEEYCNPIFKPDFSPDTLLGVNYIGNCYIIKTSLLKEIIKKYKVINIFQILTCFINEDYKIKHISRILYHDLENIDNEKEVVEEYLKENKLKAKVITNPDKITNIVEYIPVKKSLVSIIIPTKDHADILKKCIDSIYEKTTYKNYEIIVIDNNSSEEETFKLLKDYSKKYDNFKTKRIECEFNYSYLNNEAAKLAKGDYLLLLNNDIEVITPEWLERMLGYGEQKHIGTVGVKLIFPDNTIQHAGIIMGKGGLAGHAHYAKDKNYLSPQYELRIPYNYSASTAACLLIEKKKFEEVNGLEEKLKVAFNDVDFNLKILEKGYYNVFLPNVELYHYESKSRGLDTSVEKQKRFVQEWSLMKEKWNNYMIHDPFYNDNFSKEEEYKLREMDG